MHVAERAVLRELLLREIEGRFRGSLLGGVWLLLLPVLQLAVLAWVFGHLLQTRTGSAAVPYTAFLALGLWPWSMFANAVGRCVSAYTANADVLRKVAVQPRLYLHAALWSSVAIDALGFMAVLVVLWALGTPLQAVGVGWVVLALALILLWAQAMAECLALLEVFVRDISAVLGQVLTLWFFLTPVIYERSRLAPELSTLLGLNPITSPIETIRAALTGDEIDPMALLFSAVLALFLLVLARWAYGRLRPHLEDYL